MTASLASYPQLRAALLSPLRRARHAGAMDFFTPPSLYPSPLRFTPAPSPIRSLPQRPKPEAQPYAIMRLPAPAHGLLRALCEVLEGKRHLGQLDTVISADVLVQLQQLGLHQRTGQIIGVRVQVHDDAVEAALRIIWDGRPQAMAARLSRRRSQWLCTALEYLPTLCQPVQT